MGVGKRVPSVIMYRAKFLFPQKSLPVLFALQILNVTNFQLLHRHRCTLESANLTLPCLPVSLTCCYCVDIFVFAELTLCTR